MQTIIIGDTEYQWAEGASGLCLQKAIQVGATQTKNGKTYVFNENKRWTLKREPKAAKPAKLPAATKQLKPRAAAKPKALGPKAPTKKLLKIREQSELMGQKVGPQRLTELRRESTSEEHLHAMLKQETGGVRKKRELKPKAMPADLAQMRSEVLSQPLTPKKAESVPPRLKAIAGGRQKPVEEMSLKELFGEADRVGSKYQDAPSTLDERREAKEGAQKVMDESGMTEAVARASGKLKTLKPKTSDRLTPDQAGTVTPLKPKTAPKPTAIPTKPPSSPKVKPRKGERRSLTPKASTPTPQPPAPIVQQIESHPEIQVAAKRVGAIARAMESVRSMGDGNAAIAKLKATAQANPGAVEDIAVAAIAMAGQFALMPQADLATAALMQGAIGVATRAGARTGKRIREELKTDPNTLKSLQGVLKLGKGILSDLMSQESQEKMIGDAIGPSLAAGTGAAVGGGLAGAVAGTGAAVGGAPRAAAAIRQVAAQKLQLKAPRKLLQPKAA